MDVALINIGSELLNGSTLNTCAHYIEKRLSSIGLCICLQISVPDEEEAVLSALSYASKCASFILTTGGLGPTLDDLTIGFIETFAKSHEGAPFPEIKDKICSQSDRFKKEKVVDGPYTFSFLPNSLGMARGLLLELSDIKIACLPGVPHEMEQMLEELVVSSVFSGKRSIEILDLFGLEERDVDPILRHLQKLYPQVNIGIYPYFSCLSVSLQVQKAKEIPLLKECKLLLEREFPLQVLPECEGKIEKALYKLLSAFGKTLAVAESCTGGRISSLLTQLPGVSSVFQGGVIVYNNLAKTDLLGVNQALLEKHGAVSEQVALEMAREVKKRFKAAFGLSTTGIAGPTGDENDKPVGTVWIGYSLEGGEEGAFCIHTKGVRHVVIERSSQLALAILYSALVGVKSKAFFLKNL